MSTPPNSQTRDSESNPTLSLERTQVWFNGILAAVAVIGLFLAWRQLNTMQAQNSLIVLGQRSWMQTDKLGEIELTAGKRFAPKLSILNTGKSPATLTGMSALLFDSEEFKVPLGEQAARPIPTPLPGFILPPGGEIRVGPARLPTFDDDEVREIANERRTIYLLVRITYSDGSTSSEHYTQACYIYRPRSNIFFMHIRHNIMK